VKLKNLIFQGEKMASPKKAVSLESVQARFDEQDRRIEEIRNQLTDLAQKIEPNSQKTTQAQAATPTQLPPASPVVTPTTTPVTNPVAETTTGDSDDKATIAELEEKLRLAEEKIRHMEESQQVVRLADQIQRKSREENKSCPRKVATALGWKILKGEIPSVEKAVERVRENHTDSSTATPADPSNKEKTESGKGTSLADADF
jgi:hypothetical protein